MIAPGAAPPDLSCRRNTECRHIELLVAVRIELGGQGRPHNPEGPMRIHLALLRGAAANSAARAAARAVRPIGHACLPLVSAVSAAPPELQVRAGNELGSVHIVVAGRDLVEELRVKLRE